MATVSACSGVPTYGDCFSLYRNTYILRLFQTVSEYLHMATVSDSIGVPTYSDCFRLYRDTYIWRLFHTLAEFVPLMASVFCFCFRAHSRSWQLICLPSVSKPMIFLCAGLLFFLFLFSLVVFSRRCANYPCAFLV